LGSKGEKTTKLFKEENWRIMSAGMKRGMEEWGGQENEKLQKYREIYNAIEDIHTKLLRLRYLQANHNWSAKEQDTGQSRHVDRGRCWTFLALLNKWGVDVECKWGVDVECKWGVDVECKWGVDVECKWVVDVECKWGVNVEWDIAYIFTSTGSWRSA
jgi:hypothetical protein